MFRYRKWAHACASGHSSRCEDRQRHHAPREEAASEHSWWHAMRGGDSGFGVRRPLRFMARRLDLTDSQVADLAVVIDDLKTERAQARVDHRRALGAFADAFLQDDFDASGVEAAAAARAASQGRVEEAVARALARTFEVLAAPQRKKLAYLLRSGELTI